MPSRKPDPAPATRKKKSELDAHKAPPREPAVDEMGAEDESANDAAQSKAKSAPVSKKH